MASLPQYFSDLSSSSGGDPTISLHGSCPLPPLSPLHRSISGPAVSRRKCSGWLRIPRTSSSSGSWLMGWVVERIRLRARVGRTPHGCFPDGAMLQGLSGERTEWEDFGEGSCRAFYAHFLPTQWRWCHLRVLCGHCRTEREGRRVRVQGGGLKEGAAIFERADRNWNAIRQVILQKERKNPLFFRFLEILCTCITAAVWVPRISCGGDRVTTL